MEPLHLGGKNVAFIREVESESLQKVSTCYQCGNCTAGCPMSFTYDYTANQIMRLIQLGQKEKVLSCKAIWMCATCEACTTRCPNNIDVARVLDVCRHMARREKYPGVRNVRLFADSFLHAVKMHGKAHELGLMVEYKLKSGKFFADMSLAPAMLLKGKLPIMPHRADGRSEVADIFKRFEAKEHLKAGKSVSTQSGPAGETGAGGAE